MTYTPPAVSAPARLPWVVGAIVFAALDVLRLDPGDDDGPRVEQAAETATALIDAELDYDVAPDAVPLPVFNAAVTLTVELYRRKDAPFGLTDSWSIDGAQIRISSDVMRGTESMLAPYRSRRGVA